MPGRERHAVAAGGASKSAGGEKGGREVNSVHSQGSSRSHGPLLLLGGGQPGENLHLRLRERYGLFKRRFLKHVPVCLLGRGEIRSRAKMKMLFFTTHTRSVCGCVCKEVKKKVFFNLARDRYSRFCSYCVHYSAVLYSLFCVTPHPLGPTP